MGSLAVFKQHYAPHFLLGLNADAGKLRIAQLVQMGTIGAALKANNNKAVVQIEMVGYSQKGPWLPDDGTVVALASLMAVCQAEYGFPLDHPWPDGDFGKAGNDGGDPTPSAGSWREQHERADKAPAGQDLVPPGDQ